ncbi:MAG: hypothetical protein FWH04_00735 [Oscillospiraceae bacterium]|nr:hypothetical protein [Oscillospiraceae bacterium]
MRKQITKAVLEEFSQAVELKAEKHQGLADQMREAGAKAAAHNAEKAGQPKPSRAAEIAV